MVYRLRTQNIMTLCQTVWSVGELTDIRTHRQISLIIIQILFLRFLRFLVKISDVKSHSEQEMHADSIVTFFVGKLNIMQI